MRRAPQSGPHHPAGGSLTQGPFLPRDPGLRPQQEHSRALHPEQTRPAAAPTARFWGAQLRCPLSSLPMWGTPSRDLLPRGPEAPAVTLRLRRGRAWLPATSPSCLLPRGQVAPGGSPPPVTPQRGCLEGCEGNGEAVMPTGLPSCSSHAHPRLAIVPGRRPGGSSRAHSESPRRSA